MGVVGGQSTGGLVSLPNHAHTATALDGGPLTFSSVVNAISASFNTTGEVVVVSGIADRTALLGYSLATETNVQVAVAGPNRLFEKGAVRVVANTTTGTSRWTFRDDSIDTAIDISIGAGVTGHLTSVAEVTVISSSMINWRFTSGGGGAVTTRSFELYWRLTAV